MVTAAITRAASSANPKLSTLIAFSVIDDVI